MVIACLLVGCGGISRAWLAGIQALPTARLVGLVDLDQDRLQWAREQFAPDAVCGSDVTQVVGSSGALLVTNSSSPIAHHPTCTAALEAGAHVLCEKPLTEDLAEAEDLIAIARRCGRHLAVCHNRRVSEDITTVRRLLDTDGLGPVQALRCDFRRPTGGPDNHRAHLPHVLLWDLGIHHLDQARYLAGADPVRVYADDWCPADCRHWRHGPACDALVRFANGVRCNYRAWYGGLDLPACTTDFQSRWRISCEHGVIDWHGTEILVHDAAGSRAVPVPEDGERGTSAGGRLWLLADMCAALQEGRPPAISASDHIISLRLVSAAIASAESGAPQTVV
ncbi:MAG: Gfo/Idh/MocA family protein [Planctomycetota bacterium]